MKEVMWHYGWQYGWVQRSNPRSIYRCNKVSSFLIDETMLQIGFDQAWLWITAKSIHRQILGVYISRHRNMLDTESFPRTLIKIYGKHTVYSDGGSCRYPEACSYLDLKDDLLHSPYERVWLKER
jgi:transposase-like protein